MKEARVRKDGKRSDPKYFRRRSSHVNSNKDVFHKRALFSSSQLHRATPIMSIYTITIQQFKILMIHTTLNNLITAAVALLARTNLRITSYRYKSNFSLLLKIRTCVFYFIVSFFFILFL